LEEEARNKVKSVISLLSDNNIV